MPVYTSSCIFFTMPIWATLMGFFFLGEPINKYDILSVFSAFCGVLFINDPLKLFKEQNNEIEYSDNDILIGTILSLIGGISGAGVMIILRRLKSLHYSISPFWYSLGSLLISPFL